MIRAAYLDDLVLKEIVREFRNKKRVVLEDFFAGGFSFGKGQEVWVPDRHRFRKLSLLEVRSLRKSLKDFFGKLFGKEVVLREVSLRRFVPRDYTVLHDSSVEKGRRFFLFLSVASDWRIGGGGSLVVTRQRGEGRSEVFVPKGNSLGVIDLSREDEWFVSYLRAGSPKEGFVLLTGLVE